MGLSLNIADKNLHEITMNPDVILPPLCNTGQYAPGFVEQLI